MSTTTTDTRIPGITHHASTVQAPCKPKTYTQEQRDADIEAAIEDVEKGFQARLAWIFPQWESQRDQALALFYAIASQLTPRTDEEDSPDFNAWKLAEVGSELLSSTIVSNKFSLRISCEEF